MLIDTHVHLSSPDEISYPPDSDPPFVTAKYVNTAETVTDGMTAAGVRKAVIVQPFGIYGTDNSYQADSVARYGDRFAAVCGVPLSEDGPGLLQYWVGERGMDGGRVSTLGTGAGIESPDFLRICRAAEELGTSLCLLTSKRYLPELARIAECFPGLPIVLDHLGIPGAVEDVPSHLDRLAGIVACENVFLKISTQLVALTPPDVGRRILDFVLSAAGSRRVLWGSNYPVSDLGKYATTVAASLRALDYLNTDERQDVLGGTAQRIWERLAGNP
jgi:predicted TIM-barrel fold metal-dependent hydrolase